MSTFNIPIDKPMVDNGLLSFITSTQKLTAEHYAKAPCSLHQLWLGIGAGLNNI